MMDCLYAKCGYHKGPFALILLHSPILAGIPCVTDCVIAELEKLGQRYRLALRCVTVLYVRLFSPHSSYFS